MSLVLDEFYKNLTVSHMLLTQMDQDFVPSLFSSLLPLTLSHSLSHFLFLPSLSTLPSLPSFLTLCHPPPSLIHSPLPPFLPHSVILPPLQAVGVSSLMGMGIEEFFKAVDGARAEYEK